MCKDLAKKYNDYVRSPNFGFRGIQADMHKKSQAAREKVGTDKTD